MASRTIARSTATVLVTATMAIIPLAGVASAAPAADRDCADYPTRAAAQAALAADPSDPYRLDADNDGLACEDNAGSAGGSRATTGGDRGTGDDQVSATPVGSVDAGDGSASATGPVTGDDAAPLVLAGFATLAAAGAVGAVWSTRRSGRSGR